MASPKRSAPRNDCPCGSGQAYPKCCKPYHLREALPATAEQLMRSRYSAFAKRLDSYLLWSWAPETRPESLTVDKRQTFLRLEIHDTDAGGPDDAGGEVTFSATYELEGSRHRLRERSRFRRLTEEDDRWVYVDGDVR